MRIEVRNAGDVTILDLTGRLVLGTAERAFSSKIKELLDAGAQQVAVNLAEVQMLDSSGIGAMVRAHSSVMRAGGRCRYLAAQQLPLQTLKMVRLDRVLYMYDDESAALAGF